VTEKTAKQIIVVRHDLNYGTQGKKIAQSCHASLAFLTSKLEMQVTEKSRIFTAQHACQLTAAEVSWIHGQFTKICVRVDSLEELLEIHEKALQAGLTSHLIKDAGHTVFPEPTYTAVGIGPNWSEDIDKVTGHLKLL
jgi:PTH2 family peptidyl-tRNA hydrolase